MTALKVFSWVVDIALIWLVLSVSETPNPGWTCVALLIFGFAQYIEGKLGI